MPAGNKKGSFEQLVRHVAPAILKPLRALWNEIIGFLFLAIAVPMIFGAIRAWHAGDFTRILLAGGFAVMLIYFGVSSFLRARKISRS
jgi:hypothetical protein